MAGGFQKGQSGNPGGRPKKVVALYRLARSHSRRALEVAVELMENTGADLADERARVINRRVRLEAAKLVVSYGMGAPPKTVERETKDPSSALDGLTTEELRELARQPVVPDEPVH